MTAHRKKTPPHTVQSNKENSISAYYDTVHCYNNGPCFNMLKYYSLYFSALRKETKEYFFENYSIIDLYDNPLCGIVTIIHYVKCLIFINAYK